MAMLLLLGLGGALALSGCGSGNGFIGQQSKSYTVTVTGMATGVTGVALQHSTNVTLVVQ
jgi:hypothetical protein